MVRRRQPWLQRGLLARSEESRSARRGRDQEIQREAAHSPAVEPSRRLLARDVDRGRYRARYECVAVHMERRNRFRQGALLAAVWAWRGECHLSPDGAEAMSQPCPKCGGTGLVPREGEDARIDLHPLLSKLPGLCEPCGGSGAMQPKDEHAANRAAAKAAES